ncbi:COG1470 family protein [Streptomyces wuyuanensis]|uniref:COG1470 family protein n=1 Tax=Streptomyces wuyuanensis TaxID=1196353 RepID=UPI00341A5ADD
MDSFTLDVLGEAAEWTTVEPSSINVFPGDDARATLTFAPPRSAEVTSGGKAFALRVMAREDTEGSVVQEGTVEVGTYTEVAGELVPRTVRGARVARTKVAVDNLGNGPVTVQLMGSDESGDLAFQFVPPKITIEAGTTRLVPLRVRMKRRFMTGQPKTLPMEVTVLAADGSRTQIPGVVVQPPLLPRWLPKAATFATAGLVLALVIGPTILNAAPKSSAAEGTVTEDSGGTTGGGGTGDKDGEGAKEGEGDKPGEGTASPSDAPDDSTGGSAGGTSGGTSGGGADTGKQKISGSGGGAAEAAVTIDSLTFRLESAVKPADKGPFTSYSRKVEEGQTISISDIVLENAPGSKGTLEIRKNSDPLLRYDLARLQRDAAHWLEPIVFEAGDRIVLAVRCTESDSDTCAPAALFSGRVITRES